MSASLTDELGEFHQFLGSRLSQGESSLTPEEILVEWRAEHPLPEDLADSLFQVRQALADMQAGDRGRPAAQVTAELRQRLGIAARS